MSMCDLEEFRQHCNAQGAELYNEIINGECNVLDVGRCLFNTYMMALANAASISQDNLDTVAKAVHQAMEETTK